ncbi:arad-like aldolase/epimerase [Dothidotthia symphoricarpi CBS 119687]|uniref:Arad-like aldolase/epimerase n=1 Tax=Dothidotthia symphoricarpi CBS 119687 TaxID=1392245 RepID=A0A6A6AF37_9PLEO|nr:arad-like aldolase/epimerase [Dothidotthia symphoricarpi CBS 119687]KAF2130420.1 arad-like aldolase/epimerase [Dothidotthia symphoricarpi CBS 119687]
MSPPSALEPQTGDDTKPNTVAPNEPGLNEKDAKVKMPMFPRPPKFDDPYKERAYLKGRLAAAFRIFGKYGFDEGVAGHITLRDPVDPTTFWVNPFGVAFSLIKSSDLILVNHDGEVIDGGEVRLLNSAAYMIHSAIHSAREDVMCAAHSHSLYGRTFCAFGRPLDITTQDSCAFHNDHVVYDNFEGVVLAQKEGQNIAKALGDKKAALLQNHGLLTVGKSIEEAVFWFISLEKCCHTQLLADAAARGRGCETVKIGEEEAAYTHKTIGSPMAGYFSAKPLFDVVHKETGGDYLE